MGYAGSVYSVSVVYREFGMNKTIPTEISVTVHAPDMLVCSIGLEVKRIDSGHVILEMGGQEISMSDGNTLQLQFNLNRKEVSGLFGEQVLESLEQFLNDAKGPRKGWFGKFRA